MIINHRWFTSSTSHQIDLKDYDLINNGDDSVGYEITIITLWAPQPQQQQLMVLLQLPRPGASAGWQDMAGWLQTIMDQQQSIGFRFSPMMLSTKNKWRLWQLFTFFSSHVSQNHHAIASIIWRTIFVTTATGQALPHAPIIIWFDKPLSFAAA